MQGEYKLLWATDVSAHYEAEEIGMEVFASKSDCEASDLVREGGEKAIPIIVFVPALDENKVLDVHDTLQVFNEITAAIMKG